MNAATRFHSLSPWERVRVRVFAQAAGLIAAQALTPALSRREREQHRGKQ